MKMSDLRLRQAFDCREFRGSQEFSFGERNFIQLALLEEFNTSDSSLSEIVSRIQTSNLHICLKKVE